jgi:hypothetical protein
MKRFVSKPKQMTEILSATPPKIEDPVLSDISVDRLIADGLLALYREIKQLLLLSARGKLEPNDARDLRDHLKMLFEIKDRESSLLNQINDEEINKLLEKVNDGNKQESSNT